MKTISLLALLALSSSALADPQISSWITAYSAKYGRIYTNSANALAGVSATTWTSTTGQLVQSLPAYVGMQSISYSADWVYFTTTDLGPYIMGPWYNDSTRTTQFINLPVNQNANYRIPRTATLGTPPTHKTPTAGTVDAIGYFIDGVAMFDPTDGFTYANGTESSPGTGWWHRDAYVNEAVTFDPGNSHQQNTGTYHNHADPLALRYLVGDNVVFNAATDTYSEGTTTPTQHSPLLGWTRDGLPVYGPYGYSTALNSASGIRRMVGGFVLRNGVTPGVDNITVTGRTALPAWATRNNGGIAEAGPNVSTTYPLGRYIEDWAYLGDLINPSTGAAYVQGDPGTGTFDLNEYNVRYCVTPEFPGGTYAYFMNVTSTGTPQFPYNTNIYFYGNATGGTSTPTETVTTYFTGGANTQEAGLSSAVNPASGNVTFTWSSVEGGTYTVQATSDLVNWTTLSTTQLAASDAIQTSYVEDGAANANTKRFYSATRTATAAYDGASGGIGAPTVATSAATNVGSATATLNGTVTADNFTTTASFQYGLTTSYGSIVAATPSSITGMTATSIAAALTGLNPSTTYHFQAIGVNSSGTTYGADTTFTTTASGGGGGGGGTSTAPGGSATRGTSVTVTITLIPGPPLPSLTNAQGQTILPTVTIADANVGTITGTSITRPAQNTVIATFAIPAGAAAGSHTIAVDFPAPQGQQQGADYAPTFTFN